MNTVGLLHNAARVFGRLPAISVGDAVVCTYAQLSTRVARLAGGLRTRLGLGAGQRVVLYMNNGPRYFEVLFATWHAGLAAVPIHAKLHPRELAYVVKNSGASACFISGGHTEDVSRAAEGQTIISVDEEEYERLLVGPVPAADVGRDDIAWLFYTSGTTGKPKGAMLSHLNLQLMTWSYLSDCGASAPGDGFLMLGPMSHACGLIGLGHIAKASNNVLPASGGFEPSELGELINRNRNSTFFVTPTMLRRLLEDASFRCDVNRIGTILGGAAPFFANDVRRALAAFGPCFTNGYGQGECPCTISLMPKYLYTKNMDDSELVSVGIARSGVELRLVDAEGRDVGLGQPGEIIVRSDIVMRGYLDNVEATSRTIRGGWLHTGDIGVQNDRGLLWLVDRNKDVIISGGSNIYPREVEEVLLKDPDVADVAVVGEPDPEWGESVAAFVVLRVGAATSAERLDRLCLENLARFKRPKRYLFLRELPRNSTGKVQKSELRKTLAESVPPNVLP